MVPDDTWMLRFGGGYVALQVRWVSNETGVAEGSAEEVVSRAANFGKWPVKRGVDVVEQLCSVG